MRILTIIYLLGPIISLGQNLIPNPSFECGAEHCSFTALGPDFAKYVCDWSCPTGGTSDVFSTELDDKKCWASMPYDTRQRDPNLPHIGSQLPRTGHRFAGIHPFSLRKCYHEYLQAKLTSPLIPGQYYCAEMYVTSASRAQLASNDLGMAFYDTEVISDDNFYNCLLHREPQVVESEIITDTVNWVKISGTFRATSAAQYVSIGDFSEDQTLYSYKPGSYPDFDRLAYYFIDDVSVQLLQEKHFTFLGETTICEGEHATIQAIGDLDNLKWTILGDSLTTLSNTDWLSVEPKQTTTYLIKGKNCSLPVMDTITIHVNPTPKISVENDTTICPGEVLFLDAGVGAEEYQWGNNFNEQYLAVHQPGKYSFKVTNKFGCNASGDINVSAKKFPQVNLGNDTLICHAFFPLNAGNGNALYHWSTGSTDSVFTPTIAGRYWVMVENACGQSSDSIMIQTLFIPNVLTLNQDGKNEKFQLSIIEDASGKPTRELDISGSLKVFDKWGKPVYVNDNYQNDWPKENDEPSAGTYYFTYHYGTCENYKGWIQVLK